MLFNVPWCPRGTLETLARYTVEKQQRSFVGNKRLETESSSATLGEVAREPNSSLQNNSS